MRSFKNALNGIVYFFKTVYNARIHLVATIIVICFAFYCRINGAEWLWIIASIFLVLITEMLNTAIEKVVDKASPEKSELAKRSKDMAAGAVLMAAIFSVIIAVIIFYPYIRSF